MRKNIIFCLTLLLLFSCCRSNKTAVLPEEKINHSFLDEKASGSEITVYGTLHYSEERISLKENEESRSAVTFLIEADEKQKKELKKYDNKKVQIKALLLEAPSVWTKKIKLISIEK